MKFTKSRITTAIITALLPLSVMANEATTSLDIQQINLVTTPDNSVSSLPAGFVEYDGKLFFTAKDNN
jgi:hypothetical protein